MKKQKLLLGCAVFTLMLLTSLVQGYAQSVVRRFEISENGQRVATVMTSADNELVEVSVYRKGQPTHQYRTYVQLPVTDVRVNDRRLFSVYHKLGLIDAPNLNLNLKEDKGIARRARSEVIAIRNQLQKDMRLLRAVRSYDKTADVTLAELAYVILTYDDSIFNSETPTTLLVTEVSKQAQNL